MPKLNRRNFIAKSIQLRSIALSVLVSSNTDIEAKSLQIKANMVIIWKSKRKMTLFHNKKQIKTYSIRLGFNPIGHKQKEGDGKTPEGRYFITHHNPTSAYHLSLGISYPNQKDRKNALIRKEKPGNDIFIHGGPRNFLTHFFTDWTGGCIAVLNREIEEIYHLVPDGTVVYIYS